MAQGIQECHFWRFPRRLASGDPQARWWVFLVEHPIIKLDILMVNVTIYRWSMLIKTGVYWWSMLPYIAQGGAPPVMWTLVYNPCRDNPLISPSEIVLINQLNANELGHHLVGGSPFQAMPIEYDTSNSQAPVLNLVKQKTYVYLVFQYAKR